MLVQLIVQYNRNKINAYRRFRAFAACQIAQVQAARVLDQHAAVAVVTCSLVGWLVGWLVSCVVMSQR